MKEPDEYEINGDGSRTRKKRIMRDDFPDGNQAVIYRNAFGFEPFRSTAQYDVNDLT
jgi:hypothetical protein